jgi:hypothetical protein
VFQLLSSSVVEDNGHNNLEKHQTYVPKNRDDDEVEEFVEVGEMSEVVYLAFDCSMSSII